MMSHFSETAARTNSPIVGRTEAALALMPLPRLALWVSLGAMAWSVLILCPRFEHWTRGYPYSWETFRGAQFMLQCADPVRRDIEPALHWRLLLPSVAYGLGLRGAATLVVPWIGVTALLATSFFCLVRQGLSRSGAVFVVLSLSLTGGVLAPLDWLGVTDAWAWCALTIVTCGRSSWSLAVPGLLAPWIDERYMIALPLAISARVWGATCWGNIDISAYFATLLRAVSWTLPYLFVRAIASLVQMPDGTTNLALWTWEQADRWLPYVPRGLWVGARAVWLLPFTWIVWNLREWKSWGSLLPPIVLVITLGVTAILACDLSRSSAVAWPAFLAGALAVQHAVPSRANWIFGGVLAANSLLPGGHAVDVHILWLPSWPRYFLGM